MTAILFFLMIISLFLLVSVGLAGFVAASIIFKATTSLLFIFVALSGYLRSPKNRRYFINIFLAMVFSFFGDVFLSLTKIADTFLLGFFSFLLAQIIYIYAFSVFVKITLQDFLWCAALTIPPLCIMLLLPGFEFAGLLPLLVFYTVLISFMTAKAISLKKLYEKNKIAITLTIAGAVLFYISDFVLVFNYYYPGAPKILSEINLVTYYIGQSLIALSFYKGISPSWRVRGKRQLVL